MPIEVKNLFYTYSEKTPMESHAVNGVSLTIPDHSFVAIVGKTGSGKSTLVQHLNALISPTSGELIIDGFHITGKKTKRIHELRKHVGLVFQFPEYQLFEETIEKDVAFGAKNFGSNDEEALKKAHEALLSVGIPENYFKKSPFDLSGGEKRRIAIAGILAINPDILVLDEPTAGLDPEGANSIMNLVNEMHKNGKTIILVTHDMELVEKYCELVYVLDDGKLQFEGKPSDLFASLTSDSSIEIPPFYKLLKNLENKLPYLKGQKIHDMSTLISVIKEHNHE